MRGLATLVLVVLVASPALAADVELGAVQVLSSGPSGYVDGQGLVARAGHRWGRFSVSADSLLTNRPKWHRQDERSGPHTWQGNAMLGVGLGPVDFLGGNCWSGWRNGGEKAEGKSSAAPCVGAQVSGGWGSVRLTAAEYQTFAGERDQRFSIRAYTLAFSSHLTERVSMIVLLNGGGGGWGSAGIGFGWRW